MKEDGTKTGRRKNVDEKTKELTIPEWISF